MAKRAIRCFVRAPRGLILVTQDILHSDWLAHEAGALSNRVKHPYFMLADTPLSLVPTPLRDRQWHELSNSALAEMFESLAKWKKARTRVSPRTLNRLYAGIESVRSQYSGRFVTAEHRRWQEKWNARL